MVTKEILANGFGDGADVVVERHSDAAGNETHVIRRRKPMPSITLEVTRGRFGADGLDYAEVVARILDPYASEEAPAPVYLTVAGDVTFEVNLSTTAEPMDGTGKATFRLSTTSPGTYTIRARLDGYGEAGAQVEAVMV